eukprot:403363488
MLARANESVVSQNQTGKLQNNKQSRSLYVNYTSGQTCYTPNNCTYTADYGNGNYFSSYTSTTYYSDNPVPSNNGGGSYIKIYRKVTTTNNDNQLIGIVVGVAGFVIALVTTLIIVFCCCTKVKHQSGRKQRVCRKSVKRCGCCKKRKNHSHKPKILQNQSFNATQNPNSSMQPMNMINGQTPSSFNQPIYQVQPMAIGQTATHYSQIAGFVDNQYAATYRGSEIQPGLQNGPDQHLTHQPVAVENQNTQIPQQTYNQSFYPTLDQPSTKIQDL